MQSVTGSSLCAERVHRVIVIKGMLIREGETNKRILKGKVAAKAR